MSMSWIIFSNNKIFYEIEESNHLDWFNKYSWYNTAICYNFHLKLFKDFIHHKIIDRYHLMCYIFAHDLKQPSYEDEEIIIGDRPIYNNATTEALEAMGVTLNFIDFWFKKFYRNY